MGGSGSMTFADVAPFVIGGSIIVVVIVVFVLVRMFRRGT